MIRELSRGLAGAVRCGRHLSLRPISEGLCGEGCAKKRTAYPPVAQVRMVDLSGRVSPVITAVEGGGRRPLITIPAHARDWAHCS